MEMLFPIEWAWIGLCAAFGLSLLLALLMEKISAGLLTNDGSVRKFTIIDLEFPSNPKDIPNIIKGIYRLPDPLSQSRSEEALKRLLFLDFLFIPAIYGSIFLLCMLVASKFNPGGAGHFFFSALGWVQIVPLLCDLAENIVLLNRVKPEIKPMHLSSHKAFVLMVWIKWVVALGAFVIALMMAVYFWLKGEYEASSLTYLLIVIGELALYGVLRR